MMESVGFRVVNKMKAIPDTYTVFLDEELISVPVSRKKGSVNLLKVDGAVRKNTSTGARLEADETATDDGPGEVEEEGRTGSAAEGEEKRNPAGTLDVGAGGEEDRVAVGRGDAELEVSLESDEGVAEGEAMAGGLQLVLGDGDEDGVVSDAVELALLEEAELRRLLPALLVDATVTHALFAGVAGENARLGTTGTADTLPTHPRAVVRLPPFFSFSCPTCSGAAARTERRVCCMSCTSPSLDSTL